MLTKCLVLFTHTNRQHLSQDVVVYKQREMNIEFPLPSSGYFETLQKDLLGEARKKGTCDQINITGIVPMVSS